MNRSFSSLLSALNRQRWPALATFAAVIGASIAYLATTPPVYTVTARLMLDEKQVSVSELGRDLSQVSATTPGGANPLGNQAELVRSQRVLKRSVNKVFPEQTEDSQDESMDELSDGLSVKIVPATNILELSYQGQDPELATKLLNAVSEAMVEESTEAIRSEAKAVREFLEREVPKKRVEAEAAEAVENRYRQASGIISLVEQTNSLVGSLASLEDQERLLFVQLQEAKTRVSKLEQLTDLSTPEDAYAAGRSGQDTELINLRTKLGELDALLAKERSRYTDDNPTIISLLRQRNGILSLYNQRLASLLPADQPVPPANIASDQLSQNLISQYITAETERVALEKKLSALQAERTEVQTRLAQLPLKQQPLNSLIRQREEATTSLKLLQSKLEEARIAEAQLISNIRIIGQAQLPSSPSGPNQKAVLVVAIVFGAILAVGIILLLEVLDNKLHDDSEVEELLNLPKLGVLPNIPATRLSLEQPDHFLDDVGLVEPYRLLLKTLEFRTHDKLQLIVVSSTVSGEGKSVVISHLAAVSAMLSRRTLIIDADLRRPSQHNLFGVSSDLGLTTVTDKNLTLLEAVQATGIENLSILTCGEPHSRPAALLESADMKSLLLEAAAHYDLVIVDTPPVSSGADAYTLSRQSDGLVMVTRPNFTPKDTLLRAVSELKGNGAPLLGFVVNGMTAQTEKYYRYPVDGYKPQSKPFKRLTHLDAPLKSSAIAWKSTTSRGLENAEK